ncbi:MAG TPA: Zn-dependent hydrolase [Terriglobales bacterium]|nr:Zn-dependent hydrolase [Terriglobales bacterium]
MSKQGVFVLLLFVSLLGSARLEGQLQHTSSRGPRSAGMHVAADLKGRLAKFREVQMPFQSADPTEKKVIAKLVEASRHLESIFWRQVDPEALQLYQSLEGSSYPQDVALRRYLWINGSRFDLLENNRPFVGTEPFSPAGGFYPQGLTRAQIEQYVQAHPEKRAGIYSPTTIVRWHGNDLESVPYHIAYRAFLEPAARNLREAAALSPDPAFANFLRLRADALLSDDYFQSDLAWLELRQPKIDLIFAPYETYNDSLLGVKATYGAAVLLRDEKKSGIGERFQKYVADVQDALPLPERDRPSKRGLETPAEVVDSPFRAGDLAHGYQAVADNLPNDPRVHEQKGSKKIFFKNFLDARVNYVILPLAGFMMPASQSAQVTAEGYLLGTVMHEISHGLGPAFAHNASGEKLNIREAIGPIYAGLEEAKADVVGMFGLKWLVDHGVLPKQKLREYYASYVADIFRTIRFGAAEAHGQAEMMEFNYLVEHGAIRRQPDGKYSIVYPALTAAIAGLAKELLEMEASGDRFGTEAWFKKYDLVPPELREALKRAGAVPVDIDPLFSFPRKLH